MKRSDFTKNKKNAQAVHAMRRFKERYGVKFDTSKNKEFADIISSGIALEDKSAEYLGSQSLRLSLYDVSYYGGIYRCVYDSKRRVIVTVLPKGEDGTPITPRWLLERDQRKRAIAHFFRLSSGNKKDKRATTVDDLAERLSKVFDCDISSLEVLEVCQVTTSVGVTRSSVMIPEQTRSTLSNLLRKKITLSMEGGLI